MDLLTNYPAFKQDIEFAFIELINEFDLKIANPHSGCYLLKGSKCNLRFTYGRGDVSCHLKQIFENEDEPGYGVFLVYRFLYPIEDVQKNTERIYDAKLQLTETAELIQNHLKNVLNGDFSWLPNFIIKTDRLNQMLNYVLFNLDKENPIKQKLWAGDFSWESDLQGFLEENDIIL